MFTGSAVGLVAEHWVDEGETRRTGVIQGVDEPGLPKWGAYIQRVPDREQEYLVRRRPASSLLALEIILVLAAPDNFGPSYFSTLILFANFRPRALSLESVGTLWVRCWLGKVIYGHGG